MDLIAQGRLLTDGLISHRVSAAEALRLFDALSERPHEFMGVVVTWN